MINKQLTVSKSVLILSDAENIWLTLTLPEKIKIYLFGTETITDWKVGSPIVFQGEYEGQVYKDKGQVVKIIQNKEIVYLYWSGFSGLEDKPENYSIITYTIENKNDQGVKFTWTQEGFANEESRMHSETGLPDLLNQIKIITENNL